MVYLFSCLDLWRARNKTRPAQRFDNFGTGYLRTMDIRRLVPGGCFLHFLQHFIHIESC